MKTEIPLKSTSAPVRKPRKPSTPKSHPNRIHELTKARRWTYAEVAERVRKIAEERNDTAKLKVHEVTISRLAIGRITLSQEWMELLGAVYSVPAQELISAPISTNLIRVRVSVALEASNWRSNSDLPSAEHFDIMIPHDATLASATLYAGEIRGPSNNLRYASKSIAILSKLEQKPGEIVAGKRYHVRVMRTDGMIEDSIKLLHQDAAGAYWLKPESDHPDHQTWTPLQGGENFRVEIIGRVRGVFFRED
jgi:transcriptional regulator with XRE-family HTH domain